MKNLVCSALLFSMFTATFAGHVEFTATDNLDGTCTITYTVTDGEIGDLALDVDADALITAVEVDSYFDFFPDAYSTDPTCQAVDCTSPIAWQEEAGYAVLPLSSLCISMTHVDTPPTVNEITLTAEDTAVGVINPNYIRGGLIDFEGNQMTTNLPINFTITQPEPTECVKDTVSWYNDWVAYGKPDCWCYPKQCRGDADGKAQFGGIVPVYTDDLDIFIQAYGQHYSVMPEGGICANYNHAAQFCGVRVYTDDLYIFIDHYGQADVPDCPARDYNFFITPE